MAYVITDECVSCGTCAGECPVEAISEGDDKYVIDADTCVDCGTCAGVCPTEAIVEGLIFFRKEAELSKSCLFLFLIFSKISLSFWNFSFQKQPPPHALTADNCEFFHPASYIGLLLFFSPLIAPVQAC